MNDFEHVGEVEFSRLKNIASEVTRILIDAGLPISDAAGSDNPPGAVVEVDPGADAAGGVYIHWRVGTDLAARNGRRLLQGDTTHPEIRYGGVASESIITAIFRILSDRQLDVKMVDDEMRPFSIRVWRSHGTVEIGQSGQS